MGRSSYPKISRIWLEHNFCLKTIKRTMINLNIDGFLCKIHQGTHRLVPTFTVWPPHLFYCSKKPIFAQMGQVTLKKPFHFIKYFWWPTHSHMTWHSGHHTFLFGVPISSPSMRVKLRNARIYEWVLQLLPIIEKNVWHIPKNSSATITKRFKLIDWRISKRLR